MKINLLLSNEEGFVSVTPIMQFVERVLKRYPIVSFIGVPQFNIPLTLVAIVSDGRVIRTLVKFGVEN